MHHLVRIIIVITVSLASAEARAEAGTQGSSATPPCVLDSELEPVEVPQLERAAMQDWICQVILDKAKGKNAIDQWVCKDPAVKPVAGVVSKANKAIEFCKNPLESVAPSGEELESARSAIEGGEQERCVAPGAKASVGLTTKTTAVQVVPSLAAQGAILRGLADFVVARAKEEAKAFLIERLSGELCKSQDGKALLPVSCMLLATRGPDGVAWGTLKAAFETDMERFPERALACAATLAKAPSAIRRLLHLGVRAGRSLPRGKSPFEVIAGLWGVGPPQKTCGSDRVACGLHMLGYTAVLMMPREQGDAIVAGVEDLGRFLKIAERRWWDYAKKVGFVDKGQSPPADLGKHLRELQGKTAAITEELIKAVNELPADKAPERAAAIAQLAPTAVLKLDSWVVAASALFGDAPAAEQIELVEKATAALKVVEKVLEAYSQVANREYAHVYVTVATAIAALAGAKSDVDTGRKKKFDEKVQRYLPFIAEIAAAKTADDVKRTLESFAAPVGAGRAKRGAERRTIALTAFAGVTGGSEWTSRLGKPASRGMQGGLFMPVGIDFSRGLGEKHSLGAFLSIIDIGALATFREEDTDMAEGTTVERTPQVGLKQVFSPGLYFVWGVDRFAFGVGASLSPELRKISMDDTVVENASALRFGVFAAIDVTLFPF